MSTLTYRDYVEDAEHMRSYAEYQKKYTSTIRESDKVLIELVRPLLPQGGSLLDIGCSTGNLLLHLKHALPGAKLAGGDIVAKIVSDAIANPDLTGIDFQVMDMLALPTSASYDVVVSNAALMFFDDAEFVRALESIGRVTKSGGYFVAFDLFHPFDSDVTIIERSKSHPGGLKFHFRSSIAVRSALESAGLTDGVFRPFSMPIDLPRPEDPASITSYTIQTVDGERLSMRGSLAQPWCHVTARKT